MNINISSLRYVLSTLWPVQCALLSLPETEFQTLALIFQRRRKRESYWRRLFTGIFAGTRGGGDLTLLGRRYLSLIPRNCTTEFIGILLGSEPVCRVCLFRRSSPSSMLCCFTNKRNREFEKQSCPFNTKQHNSTYAASSRHCGEVGVDLFLVKV